MHRRLRDDRTGTKFQGDMNSRHAFSISNRRSFDDSFCASQWRMESQCGVSEIATERDFISICSVNFWYRRGYCSAGIAKRFLKICT